MIKLTRVVPYVSLGHEVRVNPAQICFYDVERMTQTGKEIQVTKINFIDSYLTVLETPEEIDKLIGV